MSSQQNSPNEFKQPPSLDKEERVYIKPCRVDEFGNEMPLQSLENDTNLDSAIEEAAKRRNLSTLNVKSIIHHVLKDKRVLALAQRQAAEEEGGELSTNQWDMESLYEPKLTRSRVRQAVASSVTSGGISPEKIYAHLPASSPLNDMLTTEESSDDEYDPEIEDTEEDDDDEEEENEDKREEEIMTEDKLTDENGKDNQTNAMQSDGIDHSTGSPVTPVQPSSSILLNPGAVFSTAGVESKSTEEALMQETAALLASLSDVILSPVKMDTNHESNKVYNESEDEIIAKRTRSKHPLIDTSLSAIEASFIPPDAEDPPTPMELDPEDLEWQTWLNDLLNPSESLNVSASGAGEEVEDGDDDVEYNYLADQEEVEKEEFRNDRAVKISKKEVDDLLSELLNPSDGAMSGFLSGDGLDLTGAYLLESIGLQPQPYLQSSSDTAASNCGKVTGNTQFSNEVNQIGCSLSKEQSTQLWIQIQQHFQLLMQTFVLVRFEPSLQFLSKIAAQAIEEISKFCGHGEEGIPKESSLWFIPHLEEGIQLIRKLDPNNKDAIQTSPALGSHPHKLPPPVQGILMDHALFWENPHLLPSVAFDPLSTKDASSSVKYFSAEEDYLLVLGMDHYGTSAWKIIQENLFQTKTARQLQLRVKNQCSNRTGDNAIKHYRKTKEVQIPFKEEEEQLSKLPQWVIRYHKRRIEKDKQINDNEKKKEKENEHQKIATIIGSVLKQSSLLQSNTALQTTSNGSKRNLCSELDELESESKRIHTTVVDVKPKRRHCRQRRAKNSQSSMKSTSASPNTSYSQMNNNPDARKLGEGNIDQLLFAVGLEASDPDVRFACDYLTEVKVTLYRDHSDDVYQIFMDSLLKAKREKWKSMRVFEEVDKLLKPWPHLVKLFLEFLTPEDCIETNMLAEKANLESAKSFARNLQEKFSKSPIKLGDVITKLQELEDTGASVKRVQESLLPHIEMHEELVRDLRQFLYQLAPSANSDDAYEEINLVNEVDKELDEFEEIVITDSDDRLPNCFVDESGNCIDHLGKEYMSPKDHYTSCHCDLDGVCSYEKPQTFGAACLNLSQSSTTLDHTQNREQDVMDYKHTQVDSDADNPNAPCCSSHEKMSSTTDHDSESCNPSSSPHSKQPKWTRKQDKLIFKTCLKSQGDEYSLNRTVAEIASSLDCDVRDVCSRFQELLTLFKNSNKLL